MNEFMFGFENEVLCSVMNEASSVIDYLTEKVLNQRKELRNLNKALERERKRNKELEELYSSAQGIRGSEDLSWKEKYDTLNEEMKALRYTTDSGCIARQKTESKLDRVKALLHQIAGVIEEE